MKKPIFLDTTLRDGEQSPGLYFTHKEKLHIACALDNIGIEIIEAGIPSMGTEEQRSLTALKRLHLKAEILSWNRLLVKDVITSLQAGINHIHVSVPTSDLMIENKMGKNRDWIIPQMEKVISFAIEEGAVISFGAEDASRSDHVFLKKVVTMAAALGARRFRFADTLGIMTPSQVSGLIRYLSEGLTIPIDFHGHNDFGLATANALAAWESGADIISCSVLGLGERAGNTSLEEFAGMVHYLKVGLPDLDFIALRALCQTISKWTGRPIPVNKPVIGETIHTHESGIHVDGILKAPATYEFFPPEQTGGQRKLIPGKHSGRKSIHHLAQAEGYKVTDIQIEEFLSDLRARMARARGVDSNVLFQNFLLNNARRIML